MPRMNKRNIMIIGGGLVGSLTAVLFRQRGYEVDIYEKRPDMRKKSSDGDRSINLVITSRGLKGLDSAGLLSQALELSVPIRGRMIHSKEGATVYQPYGNEKECNFSISRSRLNQFLLEAAERAGARLHFDHTLEHLNFESKVARFESSSAHYDLLLGTDGVGSRVRKQLCEKWPEQYLEKVEWLEADYKELFLPSGDRGTYRLDKNALHIWPRGSHMMMALANLDGSFTMTLYMPRERPQSGSVHFGAIKNAEDVRILFKSEFCDAVPLMPRYVEEFLEHPQGRLGTVRCSKWVYKDSVALLGDAAHAIVPFFGQGMNSGFEDCTELMKMIDQMADDKSADWSDVLERFESAQKPNANAIADMALENWVEMRDRVADPKFLLRKKVEAWLETNFPESFKSRYGMVTYTLNPYSKARDAGVLHDRILAELCRGIEKPEDIPLERARELLAKELTLFNQKHSMQLATDPLVEAARRQTES